MFIFRLILLLVANCCEQSTYASLYAVFALIAALYHIDPVGLFVIGRIFSPNIRRTIQNPPTKHLLYYCHGSPVYMLIFGISLHHGPHGCRGCWAICQQ